MIEYTLTLTKAENLALGFVAFSQKEWIDNAIHERCRVAIDEILAIALEKSIETNTPLPTSKDEIVMLAVERGWIKSSAERQKEFENNLPG